MSSVEVTLPQQVAPADSRWFAVHARSRHEMKAAAEFERAGVTTFLPLVSEVHRWSDRPRSVADTAVPMLCVRPHGYEPTEAPSRFRFATLKRLALDRL